MVGSTKPEHIRYQVRTPLARMQFKRWQVAYGYARRISAQDRCSVDVYRVNTYGDLFTGLASFQLGARTR